MKKVESIIAVIIILFTFSCKKESEPGEYLLAGHVDNSIYHYEFSLPKSISITWDSINLIGFGEDSLDLDNDGIYDLVFNIQILNNDNLHLLDGLPDPLPYFYVIHRNGAGISTLTETFYSGQGSSGNATYANVHLLNDKVYKNGEWSTVDNEGKKLWGDNPTSYYPKGNWFNFTETGYLGIKINEKLGWIEIDNGELYNPVLKSYAIQK